MYGKENIDGITTQGFPGGPVLKNLPAVQAMQETRVRSLSQEDPPEERMETYSGILSVMLS